MRCISLPYVTSKHEFAMKITLKFSLHKSMYQKIISKNILKKPKFEKLMNGRFHILGTRKFKKKPKKCFKNKICSPTRVLAVGENTRGQGLSQICAL